MYRRIEIISDHQPDPQREYDNVSEKSGLSRSNPESVRNAPPLRIRLNAAERKTLDEAAKMAMEGRTTPGTGVTATWAREVLAREAAKLLKTSRK